MKEIFVNDFLYIVREKSEIPWLKIFTCKEYKELTSCDNDTKNQIYKCIEIIELAMLEFYKPDKINIAMFGNYLPHFHVHIMSRFKNDSYFPEPMWGEKQRDSKLVLPSFLDFLDLLKPKLEQLV